MIRRIAPVLCAVVLVVATSASAQTEIRGIVSHVDPLTRTVYLTDGRAVQLPPGSPLTVDGRPALLDALRPGAAFVMVPSTLSGTTVTTVTTQTTQQIPIPPPPPIAPPPAVVSVPAPAPVNVTGTIARTDPLNQTVTFRDGRVVRVGPHTMVWQQSPAISTLLPGAQVFVRDAVPVGYVPSGAAAPAPAGEYVMGTVSRVDPTAQHVLLSDGTIVHVVPATTVRRGPGRVTIAELRPGDEILVHVRRPAVAAAPATVVTTVPVPATADRYAGAALPYQGYADTRIEAADVLVMWSPQAR